MYWHWYLSIRCKVHYSVTAIVALRSMDENVYYAKYRKTMTLCSNMKHAIQKEVAQRMMPHSPPRNFLLLFRWRRKCSCRMILSNMNPMQRQHMDGRIVAALFLFCFPHYVNGPRSIATPARRPSAHSRCRYKTLDSVEKNAGILSNGNALPVGAPAIGQRSAITAAGRAAFL